MLPTLFLQPSDFANFDIELSGPNLLPQDAIEPEITFAELLSLGTGFPREPAPLAGQFLPESGNPLPAVAAEPEAPGDRSNGADGPPQEHALLAIPLAHPAIPQPTSPVVPESRPSAPAASLSVATLPAAPATGAKERGQPSAPAVLAAARENATRPLPRPDGSPGRHHEPAPAAPRTAAQQLLANVKEQTLPGTLVANAQPATEMANSTHIQLRARLPLTSATPRLAGNAATRTADLNPAETGRELRAQLATATAPAVAAVQATPAAVVEPSSMNVVQTAAAPTGQPPVPGQATSVSPELSLAARIDVPVKDVAWGEQLGQRLQLMANNQLQTAEIRLTPAELGPLRVQIAIDDGAASVTFQAQHAVTREAIEQALPRLREMLAENGLTLSQANVGEQGVQHGSRDGAETAADLSYRDGDGTAEQSQDALPEHGGRSADGLVDTFA